MKEQRQSNVVEPRASGGLHGPEKPRWNAEGMAKLPKNEEQQRRKMNSNKQRTIMNKK